MFPGPRLRELAEVFLKLGSIGFGGPAAHIAMMEDEVVRRRGWLTRETFLDLLGATNLIPGPNSTEMAIHIGHQRAGWVGLVVAGGCFILPAACITLAFAWAYVHLGSLPQAEGFLYGVKPVIIAVVVQALGRLGQSALKTIRLMVIALLAAAANFLSIHELLVLCGAGVIAVLVNRLAKNAGTGSPVAGIIALGTPLLMNGGGVTAAGLKNAAEKKTLVESLHKFIRMYRPHAAREDTVLFPAFRSLVAPDEYDTLGEEFEKKEHALFGEEGFAKIVDEVAQLEKTLGIYDIAQFTP